VEEKLVEVDRRTIEVELTQNMVVKWVV